MVLPRPGRGSWNLDPVQSNASTPGVDCTPIIIFIINIHSFIIMLKEYITCHLGPTLRKNPGLGTNQVCMCGWCLLGARGIQPRVRVCSGTALTYTSPEQGWL